MVSDFILIQNFKFQLQVHYIISLVNWTVLSMIRLLSAQDLIGRAIDISIVYNALYGCIVWRSRPLE